MLGYRRAERQDGSFAICADGAERIPAYTARWWTRWVPGDAFMTGLIDALWDVAPLGRHRRDQVRNISTDVLRQVLKVAALSVALTVARPGAAYRIGPPAIGRRTGC